MGAACCCCKHRIETDVLISAPVELVWKVLTSFNEYSTWNPFLIQSEVVGGGPPQKGSVLRNQIKSKNQKIMKFSPTILVFEPNKELRWLGSLGRRGIFDGEHFFILQSVDEKTTKVTHGENFCGCLIFSLCCCVGPLIFNNTREGFHLMNMALKSKCESQIKEE